MSLSIGMAFQYMNGIQGTITEGRQWNIILDTVITIIKYKKSTIDHDIYIEVLYDGAISYFTVSTDDGLNITTNYTVFTGPRKMFQGSSENKFQE